MNELGNHFVITKEKLGVEQSARLLMKILDDTYGRHNLSSSFDQTAEDIRSGRLQPFFLHGDRILCCAALVHGLHSIEIGRAANAREGKYGGRLMLNITSGWQNNPAHKQPLVAEIRMAAPFLGIDGGQGSQASLLPPSKLGMIPHAFLPCFHHPGPLGPDRQELFCFSSLEKKPSPRISPPELILPDLPQMNLDLLQRLITINKFHTTITPTQKLSCEQSLILVTHQGDIPFTSFSVDSHSRQQFNRCPNATSNNPFTLIEVDSFHPQLSNICEPLINRDFILAGIGTPFKGRLKLWFGRLTPCVFAHTELMRNFPLINTQHIMNLDAQFRRQSLGSFPDFPLYSTNVSDNLNQHGC